MGSMILSVLWLLLIALKPAVSRAHFESLPEFRILDETEQSVFDRPSLLSSEYSSDIYSYSRPWQWQNLWQSHPIGFEYSTGSLDGAHFFVDNRAKIFHMLTEQIEFRFTFFQERDLEQDYSANFVELIYWPSETFGLSLYGSLSFYKRENDGGVALLWRPSKTIENKLFLSAVDVTRNDRNDRLDSFSPDGRPYAIGVISRAQTETNGFWESALRLETLAKWQFPDTRYEYLYWKKFASFWIQNPVNEYWGWALRAQWDQKFESRTPWDSSATTSATAMRTDRLLTTTKFLIDQHGSFWHWAPALSYNDRSYYSDSGPVRYRDLLPSLEFQPNDNWSFQYTVTLRQSSGPVSLRASGLDTETEHRLDVAYNIEFSASATLRLMATFDVDKFGSGETWEGGDGQFRLNF